MKAEINFFKSLVLTGSYAWILLFVVCPLMIILGISISTEEYGRLPFKFFIHMENGKLNFSPDFSNFTEILSEPIYYKSLLTSLRLAVISTFFCLLIGYPIAYSIFTFSKEFKSLFLLLVMIPFWTSLLIRIYAWVVLLRNNGVLNHILLKLGIINSPLEILNSEVAVIIGIVYSYLPFMVLPVYSSLEKVKFSLLEAAQDLGCKPYKIFWTITFPLSLSGVITGSCLVFIPVLGEYVIPDLLGGVNIVTLGKIIWTEFFFNRDWVSSASISIIMAVIIIVPFSFISKLTNKRQA